ncbi:MAG: hypothetical protein DI563_29950 [Variovorax paradoxus]|uniref:Uncharacterized protein n=1 Tax=Variovorax paradoxus TaxID=34073 RepID=A0A2W5R9J9_VARPD|nr:MAG: hypothetical protein DI563_29950 [Variovorax paradoxus]
MHTCVENFDPFTLSLSKRCAGLRQAQPERFLELQLGIRRARGSGAAGMALRAAQSPRPTA